MFISPAQSHVRFENSRDEKFGYSARGLTAYTNQLNLTNYYAYDEGSRKTFETNANNELIRYTNNSAGDLLSLTERQNSDCPMEL